MDIATEVIDLLYRRLPVVGFRPNCQGRTPLLKNEMVNGLAHSHSLNPDRASAQMHEAVSRPMGKI
jgi:hypothetical protein